MVYNIITVNERNTTTAEMQKGKKMTEYRVQAILIDETGRNTIETVKESFRTTDYKATLDMLMKKHRFSNSYLYIAMAIDTQEVVFKSKENKYNI